jgi:hypothetical protein
MIAKRYVFRCVRCGAEFEGPSPAIHLLTTGARVSHCGEEARVVHVEEVRAPAPGAEQRRG